MKTFLSKLKIKRFASVFILASLVFMPFLALAQDPPSTGLSGFLNNITSILKTSVVGLIFTVAFVFFFYGVVMYVVNPEEEKKKRGKEYIVWGLTGLTIMFMVYALIRIMQNTFFKDADNSGIQPVQIK
ncbi:MAG TPA: TrbC/VirB2 family protein [Candidatus Paceibacterota bacterium]